MHFSATSSNPFPVSQHNQNIIHVLGHVVLILDTPKPLMLLTPASPSSTQLSMTLICLAQISMPPSRSLSLSATRHQTEVLHTGCLRSSWLCDSNMTLFLTLTAGQRPLRIIAVSAKNTPLTSSCFHQPPNDFLNIGSCLKRRDEKQGLQVTKKINYLWHIKCHISVEGKQQKAFTEQTKEQVDQEDWVSHKATWLKKTLIWISRSYAT